jgi:transcriptional regulator with PAS, ATPase and Fis domain
MKIDEKQEFIKILESVLGKYGMTSLIAWSIRFFLRNPYESLVVVNNQGFFEYVDKGSETFLGIDEGGAVGVKVTDLIKTSMLPKVLESGLPMIGRVFDVNGRRMIGSAYPLIRDGELIGAMGRMISRSLDEVDRINRQVSVLEKEVKSLRQREKHQHRALYTFESILGRSESIQACIQLARKAALTRADVLIHGESGTGKELFAHAIHNYQNPDAPFVSVNSPAIPFELAESELFGYKKGAFSGASSDGKPGKFELANKGTLFLDEVSSLPLSIQAKLLRVLEEREIQPLGDTRTKKVNFHLVCATNVDLKKMVEEGKFRNDLYYRIAKITIQVDPLRKRKEDIPILADHILTAINRRFNTRFQSISPQALTCLMNHSWVGNVRELINILEQACLKTWDGNEIPLESLPSEIVEKPAEKESASMMTFKMGKSETERTLILLALEKTGGNRRRAASLLNMPRSTFYKKLTEYKL